MFALDLFNTRFERDLREGAVDDLEGRRIDDLNAKMQDLLGRARNASPEMKAGLKREFDKVKDERDSYYKVRNETMGYGSLVGEEGIPGNVPAEKIPGKEDLLKGKGRTYYEGDVTPVKGGIRHHAKPGTYGGYEPEADPLARLDKHAVNRADKAMGVKFDREKKYQGGLDLDEEVADQYNTKQVKVFKDKSGKPIGEIGFDLDASPGNDDWYCWHYATGYNVLGFDNAAEATRELKYVHKHPEAVSEAGIPGSVPTEKIPGKEDLLKGKGRSYYEADQKKNLDLSKGVIPTEPLPEHGGGVGPKQHWQDLMQENRLAVGDPIVVTGPNEFEGKTGEIDQFSPSGTFVIVNLYNHGKHSMHLSDIAYNEYADQEQDEEDDWYDEEVEEGFQDFNKVEPYAVCLAGKPVKKFDYYEQARKFHDNWKQKLYREGDKAKADKITLMPLNLDEADQKPVDPNEFRPVGPITIVPPKKLKSGETYQDRNKYWQSQGQAPIYKTNEEGKGTPVPAKEFARGVLKDLKKVNVKEEGRVDPILIKALKRMPDGLATHHEVLDAAYDAYAMELGYLSMKGNYGVTNVYIPKLMGLYKDKHGLTFNEAIVASGPSQPLDDRAVRKLVWDTMKINADSGDQAIKRALAVLAKKPQSRMVQDLQDKFQNLADRLSQGIAEARPITSATDTMAGAKKLWQYIGRNLEDLASNADFDAERNELYIDERLNNLFKTADGQPIKVAFDMSSGVALDKGILYIPIGSIWKYRGMYTSEKFINDVTQALSGQAVSEAETDYSKRRQRERDVDAGKPVAKQRPSKMTDYQKKRAQDKKDMALGEDQDTSGVESAIIRRIMVAHTDLLRQFGPEKVMQAAEEVAYNVGDVDEIGTSDVSAYVAQVKQILGVPEELDEKWSQKYKSSINCANPKGFSQRAHCAGKKK